MSSSIFNALATYNFAEAAAANIGSGVIPNEISYARDPVSTDLSGANGPFPPGQLWFSSSSKQLFMLTSNAGGSATWVSIASALGSVMTLTGNSGGAVNPSSGNINVVGSGSVTVTGSGSSLTISSSTAAYLTWAAISSSQSIVAAHGYAVTSGSATLTLPVTSSVGDTFAVILDGGTSFTLAQNASQQIRTGNQITTSGTGGSVASSDQGDSIICVCTVANTRWSMLSGSQGNLLIT